MPSIFQQAADGLTLYGVIQQVSTGLRWNTFTSALEAFNATHWYGAGANNYSVAATKTVQSANIAAEYAIAVPALPAGNYTLWWYSQQGANPAVADGVWVFRDDFAWNGLAIVDAMTVGGMVDANVTQITGSAMQATAQTVWSLLLSNVAFTVPTDPPNIGGAIVSLLEVDPGTATKYRLTAKALANGPSATTRSVTVTVRGISVTEE